MLLYIKVMGSTINTEKQVLILDLNGAGQTTFFYNLFMEDAGHNLKKISNQLRSFRSGRL